MNQELRPRPGLKVRRPDGVHLSREGEQVEMNTYWRRRLESGDVEEIKPASRKAPAKNTKGGE